jgi:hypothetical protein
MNAPTELPISEVQIIFCTTEDLTHSAIDRMLADAQGGTVAIDIETAPIQPEVDRLAKLRLERAVAAGRLKAEVKLKRPTGLLKDEVKRLHAAIDNAASVASTRTAPASGFSNSTVADPMPRSLTSIAPARASLVASWTCASSPTTRRSNWRSSRSPASRRSKLTAPCRLAVS